MVAIMNLSNIWFTYNTIALSPATFAYGSSFVIVTWLLILFTFNRLTPLEMNKTYLVLG